jgi:hypothetical protein
MPVWLLMATTMSRLVSFAISNLVIASCSHGGGQIEHKNEKNKRANLLNKKAKRSGNFPPLPILNGAFRSYFRQFSRDGGAA